MQRRTVIKVEESYLHATPKLDELEQLASGDSIKTASLADLKKTISQIKNQYLRFAYERVWSILIYLAYTNFQEAAKTLISARDKKGGKVKQRLVGSGANFADNSSAGQRWNDLLECSDCGILLLVKQCFLSVLPRHKLSIASQYICTVDNKEQLRRVVWNILGTFSPADRDFPSYYTSAYWALRDQINRRLEAYEALSNLITRRSTIAPQAALVLQDLWRTPDQHMKTVFFLNCICARRTVFTYEGSNSYIPFVTDRCEGVSQMRNALNCAYLRVCVPSEAERFARHEWKHFGAAIKFLSENVRKATHLDSILKIVWLLVHYQVVSDDRSDNHKWSTHSRLLGILQSKGICINYQPSLFPAYESIVKLTGLKNKLMANDGIDVREFETCSHPPPCCDLICQEEYSMVRDLGCSKELLVAMGLINDIEVKTRGLVDERVQQGLALMERLKVLKQWTKEPREKNADVAMKIAHSFHLAAQVNVMAQLLGYTLQHPELQILGDKLALLILGIPDGSNISEADFYTMQHPLQPHFWAIFCSPKYGSRCLDSLDGIFNRSTKTNTGLPIVVVKQILQWHKDNQQDLVEHEWFWRMRQDINLEHDLSLG